jgi:mannose-6-phosphate isomerase-like protein (cupin superfamily)
MSGRLDHVVVVGAGEGRELDVVAGRGSARAVVWPGMGARLRSMHRISLAPGSRTIEMAHRSDAVYYVMSGGGEAVDRRTGTLDALVEGSMAHIDAGTPYELVAGGDGMELVGGPCPADASLYEAAGA